jgi:flagellar basal-body rod protein FlgB
MGLDDIPLLAMLKSHLGYLTERQRLISENVANSDTPGYAPKDLSPFQVHLAGQGGGGVAAALPLAPVTTSAAHLTPIAPASQALHAKSTADSEIRLDGNKVVLEEEMMKMNDARMNYNATISLYEKSIGMLQLAIRAPGKSG